jgi:hypothetical protein
MKFLANENFLVFSIKLLRKAGLIGGQRSWLRIFGVRLPQIH